MMYTLALAVIIGLVLLPSLISADCTIRNPLVGIGYNIIYGNPDGDDNLAGRDPGIEYTRQILDITYDEGKSTTIEDKEYCVPDQASTVPLTSCSYDEETYLFAGTASYQDVFSSQVSVDGAYDNGLQSFEFSLSNEYKSVEESSETTESVFFDKRAFCHESQSRYHIENIPYEDDHGVSQEFYYAFQSLPDVSNTGISDDNLEPYYNFITSWGTDIIEESDLGGRRVQRYTSTLTELYDYALETDDTSVSVGGEYNGFSSSISVDISTLSEATTSSTEFGSYYKEIQTGSKLVYEDDQWQIPDGDTNVPEPTQLYLVSIKIVCSDNGYWSTISDLDSDDAINSFLDNRCTNLEYALSTYATYLDLTAASDDTRIPVIWPDGYYGLLKPTDGCPASSTAGFDFASGWRRQFRQKNGKGHKYSKDNHFEGDLGSRSVKYYFCMKNVEYANTAYTYSWPAGHYCIFKSSYGDCPDDNFSEGYIKWGDRDKSGKSKIKSSKSYSNVPGGSYSKDKTLIYFCCREDGSATEEIVLPTDDHFYLIRKGDTCQKVYGMTVTEETFKIDSNEKRTKKAGVIPYITGRKRYTLYYCYYQ